MNVWWIFSVPFLFHYLLATTLVWMFAVFWRTILKCFHWSSCPFFTDSSLVISQTYTQELKTRKRLFMIWPHPLLQPHLSLPSGHVPWPPWIIFCSLDMPYALSSETLCMYAVSFMQNTFISPRPNSVRFSSKATLSLNFHLSLPAKSSFPLPRS